MSTVVYQETANNFTHGDQAINGRDVMSAVFGPNEPSQPPTRAGDVRDTPTMFTWEHVNYSDLEHIVTTDKKNVFTELDQKLGDHRIMSFIKVEGTPASYGKAPDFDGQLLVGFKSTGEPEKEDVAIWVGKGNTWLPILIDYTHFAKLNEANNFENIQQTIGAAAHNRQILGIRTKTDSAPIADANFQSVFVGEECIYFNNSVNPPQVSLWKSIATTGSTSSQWKEVWSSTTVPIDSTRVAFKDEENLFVENQKIGNDNHHCTINASSVGAAEPYDRIMPVTDGQLYVYKYQKNTEDGSALGNFIKVYMAKAKGDMRSWKLIFDEFDSHERLTRIAAVEEDLTEVAKTAGNNSSDITELKHADELLDGRVKEIEDLLGDETAGLLKEVEEIKLDITDHTRPNSIAEKVHNVEEAAEEHHSMITEPVMWMPGEIVSYLGQLAWNDNKRMFMGVQKGHADWKQIVLTDANSAVVMSYDELHESHDNHGDLISTMQAQIAELEATNTALEARLVEVETALAGISIWSLDM